MQIDGERGTHIMPEEWRTMNAIWAGVICEAAMMRSPSFSRSGESRTTRNSPARKEVMQDSMGSKSLLASLDDTGVVMAISPFYVVLHCDVICNRDRKTSLAAGKWMWWTTTISAKFLPCSILVSTVLGGRC